MKLNLIISILCLTMHTIQAMDIQHNHVSSITINHLPKEMILEILKNITTHSTREIVVGSIYGTTHKQIIKTNEEIIAKWYRNFILVCKSWHAVGKLALQNDSGLQLRLEIAKEINTESMQCAAGSGAVGYQWWIKQRNT